MSIVLGSIVNMIEKPTWPFCKHKNLRFDNKQITYINSEIYEANNYGQNTDLLMILL